VQALVSTSFYATPQRVTNGFDQRRLAVLLAVLERRVGLRLGRHDVFVTVTGGLTLEEPGTDLGVALAIASSFRGRPVLDATLAVGEVSLSGELRRVAHLEQRAREAERLGFARLGVPAVQADEVRRGRIEVVPLGTLRQAIESLLGEKTGPRRPSGLPRRPRAAVDSADTDCAERQRAGQRGDRGAASHRKRAEARQTAPMPPPWGETVQIMRASSSVRTQWFSIHERLVVNGPASGIARGRSGAGAGVRREVTGFAIGIRHQIATPLATFIDEDLPPPAIAAPDNQMRCSDSAFRSGLSGGRVAKVI
jgi:hypothetical protein